MNLKEIAGFLGYSVVQAKKLTTTGLKLPKSRKIVKLASTKLGDRTEVSDEQLNAFIQRFEKEDPGRYPPVEVRRELLVESNHLCAICRKPLPPRFHHMLEWSRIRHHDAKHMLVLCGGCHDRCQVGEIDSAAQAMYKAKLLKQVASSSPPDPQQATKTAKDKKTLTDLLGGFPSSWADMILAMARDHVWWYDRVPAMEGAARMLDSSLFYLYDKELWKLLRDFFLEWRQANLLAPNLFHDGAGMGFAHPVLEAFSPPELEERYRQFQQHVAAARNCLAVLVAYIHEQYPGFDFNAIEIGARERYRHMVMGIRERGSKKSRTRKRKK